MSRKKQLKSGKIVNNLPALDRARSGILMIEVVESRAVRRSREVNQTKVGHDARCANKTPICFIACVHACFSTTH